MGSLGSHGGGSGGPGNSIIDVRGNQNDYGILEGSTGIKASARPMACARAERGDRLSMKNELTISLQVGGEENQEE